MWRTLFIICFKSKDLCVFWLELPLLVCFSLSFLRICLSRMEGSGFQMIRPGFLGGLLMSHTMDSGTTAQVLLAVKKFEFAVIILMDLFFNKKKKNLLFLNKMLDFNVFSIICSDHYSWLFHDFDPKFRGFHKISYLWYAWAAGGFNLELERLWLIKLNSLFDWVFL